MLAEYGNLWTVIGTGVVILILFIVLSIFKTIFSSSFIGFVLAIYSYFVVDYYFYEVPVIAGIGLLLCVFGFKKSGFLRRIFSIAGIIFAVLKIASCFGIL